MSRYSVPEMSCGHCKATIVTALTAADPKAEVETDLENKTVTVVSALDPTRLQAILQQAGYPATPA